MVELTSVKMWTRILEEILSTCPDDWLPESLCESSFKVDSASIASHIRYKKAALAYLNEDPVVNFVIRALLGQPLSV